MPEQITEELKQQIIALRLKQRMTMRRISEETGLSLGMIGTILKGIPAEGIEEISSQKKSPVLFPMLISKQHAAKLYALAMDEGYDDVNAWIKEKLLPWYAVKRDLEWKLRLKVEPKTFILGFETAMLDSLELKELKAKLGSMSGQPTVAATGQIVNKPEAKTA